MAIPEKYQWLLKEKHPALLLEALKQFGIHETPGIENNPVIMGWAKELGIPVSKVYTSDSDVPWCGLFVAICAKRAGYEPPSSPLWALSWAKWGTEAKVPMIGDVLTFKREGGGHVGIYVGEDRQAYHVLGGNQSDQVCITRVLKNRFHAARRSPWKIAQPKSIRPVFLDSAGTVSKNEA